jgi:divalent metal cation (Fe/Co/Zn/Cd) transporter
MLISIAVDLTRSRMLYRIASKHRSQALEADALHFSTDVWSSLVVILGLAGVKLGQLYPRLEFMEKADAVAALLVAAIVVWVSVKLGARTIQALLDASPEGMAEKDQGARRGDEGYLRLPRGASTAFWPTLLR